MVTISKRDVTSISPKQLKNLRKPEALRAAPVIKLNPAIAGATLTVDASGNLLTDWISCTTPPVRDGEYGYDTIDSKFIAPGRVLFRDGAWFSVANGAPLPGLTMFADRFRWRGVRRWVLKRGSQYLTGFSKRKVVYSSEQLPCGILGDAMSFATEAEASAFAARHPRLAGWKAVLP